MVALYEEVLAAEPRNLEAIWKLQRALHYQGEFTKLSAAKRARLWERGIELADRAIATLHGDTSWNEGHPAEAASPEDRTTAAAVHFWAAVHLGLWGETKGALPAVRKGIAKRIRDHAHYAVELDETYERAVELAPEDLYNRLYLAEARLELRADQRGAALAALEAIAAAEPDPERRLEDRRAQRVARELLERLR